MQQFKIAPHDIFGPIRKSMPALVLGNSQKPLEECQLVVKSRNQHMVQRHGSVPGKTGKPKRA